MGVIATRASRHRGARHPGGEEAAQGGASVLSQVLFQAHAEECNYTPHPPSTLPIKDKDVTGEGAATQQPATRHVQLPSTGAASFAADKYFC